MNLFLTALNQEQACCYGAISVPNGAASITATILFDDPNPNATADLAIELSFNGGSTWQQAMRAGGCVASAKYKEGGGTVPASIKVGHNGVACLARGRLYANAPIAATVAVSAQ